MRVHETDPDGMAVWRMGSRPNEVTSVGRRLQVDVDDGSLPWDLTLDLVHDDVSGTHVIQRIEVRRREGGPPASAVGMRAVPIGQLTTDALALMMEVHPIVGRNEDGSLQLGSSIAGLPDSTKNSPPPTPGDVHRARSGRRRNAVTADQRASALAFYEQAKAAGTKDAHGWVATQLDIARSTAANWVTKAREERDS